jgi:hypothetical protein
MDIALLDSLAEQVAVAPPPPPPGIEGFLRLALRHESKEELQLVLRRYSTRASLTLAASKALAEAKAAIEALIADGHPHEPAGVVDREVDEDLDESLFTLSAARARFRHNSDRGTGRGPPANARRPSPGLHRRGRRALYG